MKIAISGKGGVGKTTIAGTLARLYADKEYKVLAIDADPDANLASALGLSDKKVKEIVPLSAMKDLVEERTEAKPGTFGSFFKLNPKVDDIPEKFSFKIHGVKLLVMGPVEIGGSGCICPESALLKNLVKHLLLERDEIVIMDMEAGIEHLGRGTAEAVDALIIVVEPGQRSLQTAKSIYKLAKDIGVKRVFLVGNKIRNEAEARYLKESTKGIPYLGSVSESEKVRRADLEGKSPYKIDKDFVSEIDKLCLRLKEALKDRQKNG